MNLIESAAILVIKYDVDGLDIDWRPRNDFKQRYSRMLTGFIFRFFSIKYNLRIVHFHLVDKLVNNIHVREKSYGDGTGQNLKLVSGKTGVSGLKPFFGKILAKMLKNIKKLFYAENSEKSLFSGNSTPHRPPQLFSDRLRGWKPPTNPNAHVCSTSNSLVIQLSEMC